MFFKVQLPLVAVICNPGLRERHWQDMSDLVNQNLKPNTGTTLRKLLKLNLMPYLEKYNFLIKGNVLYNKFYILM